MKHHKGNKNSLEAVGVMTRGLSTEVRDILRKRKKTACSKCNSKISYINPMLKCFECKEKFCLDHISRYLYKEDGSQGEKLRNICKKCEKDHGYRDI